MSKIIACVHLNVYNPWVSSLVQISKFYKFPKFSKLSNLPKFPKLTNFPNSLADAEEFY